MADDWDYIVVGAGSAGCVLANRLSADPNTKVLLIEAGGSDKRLLYQIPAYMVDAIGNPDSDWMFKSEPDPTRSNRVDLMARGKVLGGSSSINGTFYVRGNRGDYDDWAQMGNRGWDYDSLVHYFKRLECNRDGVSDVYGKSGPIVVSQLRGTPKLADTFIEAVREVGYPSNPSYNGEHTEGASIIHATQHYGRRFSAARGYLDPIKGRKNLKILIHTDVRRIVLDDGVATGVEYRTDGEIRIARCRREVIVSAGPFNSPKLLMVSGIGPAEHLGETGVRVTCDLPGVGKNLQEHPLTQVMALVNVRTANMENNLAGRLRHGLRFAFTRSGQATFSYSALAMVRTRRELEYPDVQLTFGAFASEYTSTGFKLLDRPAVVIIANVNRSRSRGWLELRSSSPEDPPKIFPNMLSDPFDIATLIAGGKLAKRILHSSAFEPYFIGDYKPGPEIQTEADWTAYLRSNVSGCYHPCGTCKMGIGEDAVVDPELRVRGIRNLRVADSSIIPQIPSANLNAISMAIGEKASDLVLAAQAS